MIVESLLVFISSAVALSFVVTGIVEAIKSKVTMTGLQTIAVAILIGVSLLGLYSWVFDFPMAESLLLGLLSGLGSIGAFEGIKHVKE